MIAIQSHMTVTSAPAVKTAPLQPAKKVMALLLLASTQ
jgi:hypothetical protein